jgi:hypothetical protein
VTYTCPEDLRLVGVNGAGGIAIVVSNNPTQTASQIVNNAGVYDQLISYFQPASTAGQGFIPVSYDARKGQPIFVSADGAGTVSIYYESSAVI